MSRLPQSPAYILAVLLSLASLPSQTLAAQAVPLQAKPQSLSLSEAEALARTKADSVQARAAALASAQAGLKAAQAAWLPKITATGTGAWLANPPEGITIGAGTLNKLPPIPSAPIVIVEDAKASYFKGNLSLSQPILAWGKIKAGVDLAALEVDAALVQAAGAGRDAAAGARSAYLAAKASLEGEAILGELVALEAGIVADKEAALAEGMITRAELLSAQADLADLQARKVEAHEAGLSALYGLCILTGLDPRLPPELSSPWATALPSLDEASFPGAASEAAPARQGAELRLRQAGKKLALEEGSAMLKPDLGLFASLDASGQTPPFSASAWWDSTWAWDLSLGLSVSLNVFDGGRSWARIAQARADEAAAAAALAGAGHEAGLGARRALEAAHRAEAGLARAAAKAAYAAEVLKNARLSAQDELVSRQDLGRAAMQEASSRLDLVQARYALGLAISTLESLVPGTAK